MVAGPPSDGRQAARRRHVPGLESLPLHADEERCQNSQGGAAMASRPTRALAIATTLTTGLMAGGLVYRGIIEMLAWQRTGPLAWAAYSRHADLAFPGLIVYPLEAVGGAILSIA